MTAITTNQPIKHMGIIFVSIYTRTPSLNSGPFLISEAEAKTMRSPTATVLFFINYELLISAENDCQECESALRGISKLSQTK